MTPAEIKAWLDTLDDEAHVYIDDGGLALCVVGNDAYLEIGGYTPDESAG